MLGTDFDDRNIRKDVKTFMFCSPESSSRNFFFFNLYARGDMTNLSVFFSVFSSHTLTHHISPNQTKLTTVSFSRSFFDLKSKVWLYKTLKNNFFYLLIFTFSSLNQMHIYSKIHSYTMRNLSLRFSKFIQHIIHSLQCSQFSIR